MEDEFVGEDDSMMVACGDSDCRDGNVKRMPSWISSSGPSKRFGGSDKSSKAYDWMKMRTLRQKARFY